MNGRIRELRKMLKMNQTDFGERIGVKQGTVAGYESGTRVPIDAVVMAMCKEFDVNEEWLRTGSGEPFIEKDEDDELAEWVSRVLGDRDETIQKRTLKMLHQLDASDWAAIDALVKKGLQLLNDQNSKK